MLTRRQLAKRIDFASIERAIEAAERCTSGEIRVSVAPWFWGSLDKAARKAFTRLGMQQTRERNGILFFIVPARRGFVVLGDDGIHQRVGQAFWDDIAATLASHFKRGAFNEGLIVAIAQVAAALEQHFPYHAERDLNELPNRVDLK